MRPLTVAKPRRIPFRSALACALAFALLSGPAYSPAAQAKSADICDLPGCGILEKAIDKGKKLGDAAVKPWTDAGNSILDAGNKAATAADMATDPMKYFAEMFANASGKLIQELDGELRK